MMFVIAFKSEGLDSAKKILEWDLYAPV